MLSLVSGPWGPWLRGSGGAAGHAYEPCSERTSLTATCARDEPGPGLVFGNGVRRRAQRQAAAPQPGDSRGPGDPALERRCDSGPGISRTRPRPAGTGPGEPLAGDRAPPETSAARQHRFGRHFRTWTGGCGGVSKQNRASWIGWDSSSVCWGAGTRLTQCPIPPPNRNRQPSPSQRPKNLHRPLREPSTMPLHAMSSRTTMPPLTTPPRTVPAPNRSRRNRKRRTASRP